MRREGSERRRERENVRSFPKLHHSFIDLLYKWSLCYVSSRNDNNSNNNNNYDGDHYDDDDYKLKMGVIIQPIWNRIETLYHNLICDIRHLLGNPTLIANCYKRKQTKN